MSNPIGSFFGRLSAAAASSYERLVDAFQKPLELQPLVERVRQGHGRDDPELFDQLRRVFNRSTLEQKRNFIDIFSGDDSDHFKDVRRQLAGTVYQGTSPLKEVKWLSWKEIYEEIGGGRGDMNDVARRCSDAVFFHATRKENIGSILNFGQIIVAKDRSFRGAFVSTRPEITYGPCVLAFRPGIGWKSNLENGFFVVDSDLQERVYWAGFSEAIPVNAETLACVLLENHTQEQCQEFARAHEDLARWKVPVIPLEIARPHLERMRQLNMGIPVTWPRSEIKRRFPPRAAQAVAPSTNPSQALKGPQNPVLQPVGKGPMPNFQQRVYPKPSDLPLPTPQRPPFQSTEDILNQQIVKDLENKVEKLLAELVATPSSDELLLDLLKSLPGYQEHKRGIEEMGGRMREQFVRINQLVHQRKREMGYTVDRAPYPNPGVEEKKWEHQMYLVLLKNWKIDEWLDHQFLVSSSIAGTEELPREEHSERWDVRIEDQIRGAMQRFEHLCVPMISGRIVQGIANGFCSRKGVLPEDKSQRKPSMSLRYVEQQINEIAEHQSRLTRETMERRLLGYVNSATGSQIPIPEKAHRE